MKIHCDVCNKNEASVFCTADEASLCDTCDHRVHHANKLASKHQRFSLLHPCAKDFPLCDICQERRALLFCQQDRAILCSDCDMPIHTANELTKKHNRFLLTGVKLSPTASLYTSSSSSASVTNGMDPVPGPLAKKSLSVAPAYSNPSPLAKTSIPISKGGNNLLASQEGGSTISEYLIEMLPGWHVEDLLDSDLGFCKRDDGVLPFLDADFDSDMNYFTSENLGIWVPQAQPALHPSQQVSGQFGTKETKESTNEKVNRRRRDDGFTVPQISPPATGSKRSRPLW